MGSPFAYETWRVPRLDYADLANASIVVGIQIETREGVENIDEIVSVPGIG